MYDLVCAKLYEQAVDAKVRGDRSVDFNNVKLYHNPFFGQSYIHEFGNEEDYKFFADFLNSVTGAKCGVVRNVSLDGNGRYTTVCYFSD
jgi:hypothetical protein